MATGYPASDSRYGSPEVVWSRSLATHFAGSETITRGSCRAPVTSRSGREPAGGGLKVRLRFLRACSE